MSDDDRLPGAAGEDLPPVSGMLMGGLTSFQSIVRRSIQSLGRGTKQLLWAAGTALTFVAFLVMGIAESPGLGGVVKGFFAGLFMALLFAGVVGWLLLWASRSPSTAPDSSDDNVRRLDELLAPTLRELNAVRTEVIRKVKARSVTRVPLATAAAFALWFFQQRSDDPPGFFGLLALLLVGALLGEVWASAKLAREYTRLYKNRVLPLLAARLGDLTYRQASHDEVTKLRTYRILPEYNDIKAEDEIIGTHRGLPVAIVEARLERREGKNRYVVFDGLVIELTLPRSLTGTTVLLTDEGAIGNLKTRWRSSTMERVRLEDPRFEQRYEVYGSDQVEARALLTPAFMERFMGLAAGTRFSLPGAFAEGNRFVVALPKQGFRGDLFEPPPYWKPAGGKVLLKLEEDIGSVLSMADTLMDLDFWATGRKRDSIGARP